MVKIINSDKLLYDITKYDLIVLGTNTYCNLSQGFQRDVALNYPYTREANHNTRYGDENKLGTCLECKEDNEPTFVLAYICGWYPTRKTKGEVIDYLSYESLEKCLKYINKTYSNKNIAMTMIGCSRFDGNGNVNRVVSILNETLTDVNVTVYNYKQLSRDEKLKKIRTEELLVKATKGYNEYHEMVKKRKEEAEERFKRNGFARY